MSSNAQLVLAVRGHTSDGMCEKCWQAAASMYACGQGAYESHVEAYYVAMAQAEKSAQAESAPPTDSEKDGEA